jgi:hypothetical protein
MKNSEIRTKTLKNRRFPRKKMTESLPKSTEKKKETKSAKKSAKKKAKSGEKKAQNRCFSLQISAIFSPSNRKKGPRPNHPNPTFFIAKYQKKTNFFDFLYKKQVIFYRKK